MQTLVFNSVIFIAGFALLIYGANLVIFSCTRLSFLLRLTPLFIGTVLIAFGTSAPELAVGVTAALQDHRTLALSNILGSNIANIGLGLSLCALLFPFKVKPAVIKKDVPIMVFVSALLWFLISDLTLSRIDGVILIILFITYCLFAYYKSEINLTESKNLEDSGHPLLARVNSKLLMLLIFIGFIGIVLAGAHLIVYSGVKIANIIGIKPWIIGITVFAIGTSLPEIATSLSAAFRKLPSVSVGNIVGSNIFNILLILGVVSIIRPITISDLSVLHFELPLLVFFSLTIYAFLALGSGLGRIKGGILALFYLGFIYFLFI